jgi:hypothetical protein
MSYLLGCFPGVLVSYLEGVGFGVCTYVALVEGFGIYISRPFLSIPSAVDVVQTRI